MIYIKTDVSNMVHGKNNEPCPPTLQIQPLNKFNLMDCPWIFRFGLSLWINRLSLILSSASLFVLLHRILKFLYCGLVWHLALWSLMADGTGVFIALPERAESPRCSWNRFWHGEWFHQCMWNCTHCTCICRRCQISCSQESYPWTGTWCSCELKHSKWSDIVDWGDN